MKSKKLLVALPLAAVALAGLSLAQDPHKVGPTIYKQKLDNERVRVYEITFKPGDEIAMHKHPDHAVYIVTPGTLSITESGKEPFTMDGKAGDVFYLPAQSHSAKNIGKTTFKAVVVELK